MRHRDLAEAVLPRPRPDQMVEQGHADGEAVGDLFEHAGLRAIGNDAINFQAAVHGTGMQHQGAGPRELQALRRELVA